jgi:hypothetical protein
MCWPCALYALIFGVVLFAFIMWVIERSESGY